MTEQGTSVTILENSQNSGRNHSNVVETSSAIMIFKKLDRAGSCNFPTDTTNF